MSNKSAKEFLELLSDGFSEEELLLSTMLVVSSRFEKSAARLNHAMHPHSPAADHTPLNCPYDGKSHGKFVE